VALVALAAAGCAGGTSFFGQQQPSQQQLALAQQQQTLQSRANALDSSNQTLEVQLAQSQQRGQVLEGQLTLLREQLASLTTQLTRIREEKKTAEQQVQTLTASMQRQGSVVIEPNNSLLETLPVINHAEVQVRRDGDVIRVELPAHLLFQDGTAQLKAGAMELIASAAGEITRTYPGHMLGVEGHCDSDPVYPPFRNHNHLSINWAMAVHDALQTHSRLRPEQLLVVGHGSSHAVVSNATAAGKQRNRRVELVIYPDKVGQ
jgi:chemotaxis protein MotB